MSSPFTMRAVVNQANDYGFEINQINNNNVTITKNDAVIGRCHRTKNGWNYQIDGNTHGGSLSKYLAVDTCLSKILEAQNGDF